MIWRSFDPAVLLPVLGMAGASASHAGSAFDDEVLDDGCVLSLPVSSAAPVPVPPTAFDVALDVGCPPEVAAAFLVELGVDESCTLKFFNAFDPEDATNARRNLLVIEPLSGERVLASPVQRAQVTTWLDAARAMGQDFAQGRAAVGPSGRETVGPGEHRRPPSLAGELEEPAHEARTGVEDRGEGPSGRESVGPSPHSLGPTLLPSRCLHPPMLGPPAPPRALLAPSLPQALGHVQGQARADPGAFLSAHISRAASLGLVPPSEYAGDISFAGLPPPLQLTAAPWPRGFVPATAKAAGVPPQPARRFSDVLDQCDPGTFTAMSGPEVQAAWDLHVRVMGARPAPECEPSPEQLGALRAKLRNGDAPAVDFAIWGSFDRRHARDRQSTALVWLEGGGLQPRRLSGPSSFEAWDLSWGVYAAAMIALGAAAPGALARYRTGVRDLDLLCPGLWGVVSRADQAMRFEQWPRMAFEAPPGGDWATILIASAYGEGGARQWWWDRQVVKPSAAPRPHRLVDSLEGYVPRGATLAAGGPSTSAGKASLPAADHQSLEGPPLKKGRNGGFRAREARRKQRDAAAPSDQPAAADVPASPSGPPATGLCYAFNLGKCKQGARCIFRHLCTVCGEKHPAHSVPACRAQMDTDGRRKQSAAGKAKGK